MCHNVLPDLKGCGWHAQRRLLLYRLDGLRRSKTASPAHGCYSSVGQLRLDAQTISYKARIGQQWLALHSSGWPAWDIVSNDGASSDNRLTSVDFVSCVTVLLSVLNHQCCGVSWWCQCPMLTNHVVCGELELMSGWSRFGSRS